MGAHRSGNLSACSSFVSLSKLRWFTLRVASGETFLIGSAVIPLIWRSSLLYQFLMPYRLRDASYERQSSYREQGNKQAITPEMIPFDRPASDCCPHQSSQFPKATET